jgi:hypothetical protein
VPGSDDFILGEFGDSPDRLPAFVPLEAIKLRRVVAVAQSHPIEHGEFTVASLELYEDGSIARCHIIASETRRREARLRSEEESRLLEQGNLAEFARMLGSHKERLDDVLSALPGRNLYLRLEDDLGTSYNAAPRGGGGGEARSEIDFGFTPGVPSEASRLRILLLQGDRRRDSFFASPRSPEQLIHTFEVSL